MTMTSASLTERAHDVGVPDDLDPAARPRRRRFDAEYKKRILAEYDGLPAQSSERGALLRREGLYSSHLAEWRNSVARAALGALEPKTRRPKTSSVERDLARAQDRVARLEAELARTRLALEITGKAHALLEMLSESAATEPKSKP
jgi:transposase-like protein